MLLTHGIADEEARRALTEQAAEQHAACCPCCYGMVPVPREVPPLLLNRYRGRLSAGGYRVEVAEDGLRTSLEIDTPTTRIYRGREAGQLWTRRGAMIVFVGPLVLLALVWAVGMIGFGVEPLPPVIATLLVALLVHLVVCWWWRPRLPAGERAAQLRLDAAGPATARGWLPHRGLGVPGRIGANQRRGRLRTAVRRPLARFDETHGERPGRWYRSSGASGRPAPAHDRGCGRAAPIRCRGSSNC